MGRGGGRVVGISAVARVRRQGPGALDKLLGLIDIVGLSSIKFCRRFPGPLDRRYIVDIRRYFS